MNRRWDEIGHQNQPLDEGMHNGLTGGVHAQAARSLGKKVKTARDEICNVYS